MTARLDLPKLVRESGEPYAPGSASLAGRRLGVAAAFVGGCYAIYTLLYRTLWIASATAIGTVLGSCGIAISAGVAAYLLSAQRSARQVTRVAVPCEIYVALSLALSESVALQYQSPNPQVSWSTIAIVLFPFLIPASPSVVLGAAVLSAAMTPLGMAICFSLTGRDWPSPGITASYVLPPFLCALLAWAPMRAMSQMRAAMRQARLVSITS